MTGANERSESEPVSDIRIDICRHIKATITRTLDQRNRILHERPILFARGLQVKDVDRHAAFFPNADRLADCVEHLIALIAHVRHVDSAVLGDDLRQLHQLFGGCVDAGRIDQRRGKANRAIAHRLVYQRAHLLHLRRRWLAVFFADHHATNLRRTHIVDGVHRDALRFHGVEVIFERLPSRAGCSGATFACKNRRDALAEFAFGGGAVIEDGFA